MSKKSKPVIIAMPTVAENKRIVAGAKADPDAQPLSSEQLNAMVPAQTSGRLPGKRAFDRK